MELNLNLPATSKIWLYAADRSFGQEEREAIQQKLDGFTNTWSSHEMPMQAMTTVLYHRIVVIALNEAFNAVSGCGIDKSVSLIKELGEAMNCNFFNRMQVLVLENEELTAYNKESLQNALDQGTINEDSLVFNPMVQNLGELNQNGFVKLQAFWMAPQLKFAVQS